MMNVGKRCTLSVIWIALADLGYSVSSVLVMCEFLQGVGNEPHHVARYSGRMVKGSGHVVIPGTNLQFTRYHGTDARRRPSICYGWQELAWDNETSQCRQTRHGCSKNRQSAGKVAKV